MWFHVGRYVMRPEIDENLTLARAESRRERRNANEMVTNLRCYVWHLGYLRQVIISFAFPWISARVRTLT